MTLDLTGDMKMGLFCVSLLETFPAMILKSEQVGKHSRRNWLFNSSTTIFYFIYKTSRLLLVIALWKLPTIMLPLLLKKKADPFKKK